LIVEPGTLSPRKRRIRALSDAVAPARETWVARNSYFHESDERYMRFLVSPGLRVLDLGCGTGRLLNALEPSAGVGVDFSEQMIAVARENHPHLEFRVGDIEDAVFIASLGGPFDVIILSDTIGSFEDCQATLDSLHGLCTADTRIIVSYYSKGWEPLLSVARWLRLKMPQAEQNALRTEDIENLFFLADFETVKRDWRQLIPRRLLGIGPLVNLFVAPLPVVRRMCLRLYLVARSTRARPPAEPSVSVIVPCRNERGNIEDVVRRCPVLGRETEIVFVEGHSADGTLEEMHRVAAAYPERAIKILVQDGKGKGDAVRKGFAHASGDIFMILDSDLTMPPEALPKFYEAIASGKGEFINGSRLVYPAEKDAMRFLNYIANMLFSWIFTWLLNQRFTDTLCGTKVLWRSHYELIAANRAYFGDFDPFGDFDLIFGASKANLRVVEIPIAYAARSYGETQISRFRHGMLLFRMAGFAFVKLKMI
jgi:SAM-dependent methyltransferase